MTRLQIAKSLDKLPNRGLKVPFGIKVIAIPSPYFLDSLLIHALAPRDCTGQGVQVFPVQCFNFRFS